MDVKDLREHAHKISLKAKDAKSKVLKKFYHDEYDKVMDKISSLEESDLFDYKRDRILNQIDTLPIKQQVMILEELFWKLR